MKRIFFILMFLMSAISGLSFAQTNNVKKEKGQYLYLLRLEKSMQDSTAWTPDKSKIVQEHFMRLQKMLSEGTLILAGRTQVSFDKTIGIVVFEADSFEEAKLIAENDPAVKGKIMTVEVFPYAVALMREGIKK